MLPQNEVAIEAILANDKTIPQKDKRAALALLKGQAGEVQEDRILTRAEAAEKLRISRVSVTNWGKSGIIRRVAIPGRRKAVGYSFNSVMEIVNGKAKKK